MPANYVLLERIELNASAASVVFNNIPQSGYTDLKIVASARSTDSAFVGRTLELTFNGSTSSRSSRRLLGSGSAASSGNFASNMYGGNVPTSTATSNTFGNNEIYIPNYAGSSNKSYSADGTMENNATESYMSLWAGLWSNTAAITSISLFCDAGDFVANSTFSLYGLAAVGTTPTIAPKASGGSIYTDNTYWYHAFRTTGAFTPQITLSCETLVVAGGGGCGADASSGAGGGGGAGGVVYNSSVGFSTASHTVTVGSGGSASAASSGLQGTSGVNSSITGGSLSLTAAVGGGGGGAGLTNMNGLTGGSGGGGGGRIGTGGTGGSATSSQGFAGGNGASVTVISAGGGGGAGGVGTAGGSGSSGGVGTSTYSSWGSATVSGQNVSGTYYYAGGGAGWSTGTGGSGGGGSTNVNGTVNTGGGGGAYTGNGGSGIVIIRYPIA